MSKDIYKDLSDGEVLDIIFSKFDIQDEDNATELLIIKIDMAMTYKKYLAHTLYKDALRRSKAELQKVLFLEEETTDSWTLEQCHIQYVKDQISFYECFYGIDNLDKQVEEIWEQINE
jgi:hypothetical protein|tara:strand:+ start:260 stop:613 length:354 start_codon:yes stop_codon:yes gene_type:complete